MDLPAEEHAEMKNGPYAKNTDYVNIKYKSGEAPDHNRSGLALVNVSLSARR